MWTLVAEGVTREHLAGAARAALGSGCQLKSVVRLTGGTIIGVYRLTLDDGSTVIAYLWAESENFWPRTAHDGDLAILEDFPGRDLLDFYDHDPAAAEPTLTRLREGLAAMRNYRGPSPGGVGHVDAGEASHWPSCEEGALAFALRCLAEAAARGRRLADARDRLEERLRELAAAIRPRAEYSVAHGELGLDHVLVDSEGNPVIIDVEDLMYFDVEWEHAHMQIRLHDRWRKQSSRIARSFRT